VATAGLGAALPASASGGGSDIAISIDGVVKVQKGSSIATSTPGNVAIAIKASEAAAGGAPDQTGTWAKAVDHSHAVSAWGHNRVLATRYSTAIVLATHDRVTARNHSEAIDDGSPGHNTLVALDHSTVYTERSSHSTAIARDNSHAEAYDGSTGASAKAVHDSYALAWKDGTAIARKGSRAEAWATGSVAIAICGGHAVADEVGERVFDNGGACTKR
jgi:hypothetical protein